MDEAKIKRSAAMTPPFASQFANLVDNQDEPAQTSQIKDALVDLYLSVKIRTNEEIDVYDE